MLYFISSFVPPGHPSTFVCITLLIFILIHIYQNINCNFKLNATNKEIGRDSTLSFLNFNITRKKYTEFQAYREGKINQILLLLLFAQILVFIAIFIDIDC